jgi:hypothetical protein
VERRREEATEVRTEKKESKETMSNEQRREGEGDEPVQRAVSSLTVISLAERPGKESIWRGKG